MSDIVKIQDSFSGLIGWTQPFNPEYAIVSAANLISESGYYVNSNPFAKVEYIKDCQDYHGISTVDFNTVLSGIVRNSTSNIYNQVFDESQYIDRQLLYKYALNRTETDVLPEGFVGYKIEIDDTKSVAFNITRLMLDFDGVGDITLLLLNSSQKLPLKTKLVTINSDHMEVELNWVLNDTETIYKGEYYIGYIKTASFVPEPYKRDYENSEIMSYVTHLNIEKVKVSNHLTADLFDLTKVEFMNESTGLNLDITVYDDYTDLAIQNKFLFSRAIYLSAVINCMQIYLSSLRSNRNERQAEELYKQVMVQLEGITGDGVIAVKGLKPQLLTEIAEIKTQIESIKEGYLGNGFDVITQI